MSWNKRKKDWSTIVVTSSTGVFAIISLISVYITVSSWITQREASRPYFTFKESPIVELSNQVKFEFIFRNVGTHPALELTSKTLVFDQGLAEDPLLIDEYSVVNDIPRDTVTSLLIDMDPKEINPGLADTRPYYIVICLRYADPILNDSYNQTIYIKWAGVIEGKPQPLIHAEVSEKQDIINYLKAHQLLR
jgi:fumarate reductase subunit C